MSSSRLISLFDEPSEPSRRPYSLVVSIIFHGIVVAVASYGVMHAARIKDPALTRRYFARRLEFHQTNPILERQSSGHDDAYPHLPLMVLPHLTETKPFTHRVDSGQILWLIPLPQTLLQPNLSSDVTLTQEIPVPSVVIWANQRPAVKVIVPPPSAKLVPTSLAPSLLLPNQEAAITALPVSASRVSGPSPVLPGSTSPLAGRTVDSSQSTTASTLHSLADPVPAAVVALSDLRMSEGIIFLPPVNQAAPAQSFVLPANQLAKDGRDSDVGQPDGAVRTQSGTGSTPGSGTDSGSDTGPGNGPPVGRITLSRDGQFGSVVVGSSLEEKYPETAELWSGRLAYTVYLHVGLSKNWILQYSLPRSADSASSGRITHIEAPWPYSMVRPNIPWDEIGADALMVRGFVNEMGRFEGLAVAFPPDFQQARYVLDALEQWQFRPATQSGRLTRVEVLLIIPDVQ